MGIVQEDITEGRDDAGGHYKRGEGRDGADGGHYKREG